MNIDNALYTLNIAPDARQLTVFIDGEAIPQSRPKIATRGKNCIEKAKKAEVLTSAFLFTVN